MMMYGATPTGVTSGTAIEGLREIDNTRMSLTADNIRDGVVEMAKIWLKLCKAYAGGYRVLRITGSEDAGYVSIWTREDINSFDVEYTAENELRRSTEQKKQDFIAAYNLGLFTDENGVIPQEVKRKYRSLFENDTDTTLSMEELQRKYAARENSYLEQGVLPQRGQYDDDAIHADEHIRYAISRDYQIFAKKMPQYAEKFAEHIATHQNELAKREAEAMKKQMMMRGNNNG
jgi:phage terminase Nu1 subunit (DNA packaging protein)